MEKGVWHKRQFFLYPTVDINEKGICGRNKTRPMANSSIKLVLCTKCQMFIGNGIDILIFYLIFKFKEGMYKQGRIVMTKFWTWTVIQIFSQSEFFLKLSWAPTRWTEEYSYEVHPVSVSRCCLTLFCKLLRNFLKIYS